jgi:hypothetical protein
MAVSWNWTPNGSRKLATFGGLKWVTIFKKSQNSTYLTHGTTCSDSQTW